MHTTTKNIVEGLPFPSIQSIGIISTYETIVDVHKMLNANASSVQVNIGGGAHGLLALTITPSVFNTLSAKTYNITTS